MRENETVLERRLDADAHAADRIKLTGNLGFGMGVHAGNGTRPRETAPAVG